MIVFIAGMQRSGSTFAFNIARDLLRARGQVYQEAIGEADIAQVLARSGGAEHVLVKSHAADPMTVMLAQHGALRTICTMRHVEDAAASWIETFGWSEAETVACLRTWLALYVQVRGAALLVPYPQVDRRPWLAAWRIARFLCPDAGPGEVLRIARRHAKAQVKQRTDALQSGADGVADLGFSYYDRATLFHRRHVSSLRSRPVEERLSPDQLARIRAALATDVAAAGLGLSARRRALAQGAGAQGERAKDLRDLRSGPIVS